MCVLRMKLEELDRRTVHTIHQGARCCERDQRVHCGEGKNKGKVSLRAKMV